MKNLVENYLTYIQANEPYVINEGMLHVLNKLFVILGFGSPADPKFKAVLKSSYRCSSACYRAYPDERSTTRTGSAEQRGKREQSDEDIRKEKDEIIETIKENPERGKCLVMCHYDKLKGMIDVINKNRKNICSKNINVDLCEKWIDRNLPELEADLKALGNAVNMMKGKQGGNVNVVVNTLKKIL